MEIEERELHYSPDAPLRAWRLFRVRSDRDGFVLSAPMYHDPDHPRWPNAVHDASCTEGHPAPAAGCRCGIYGAVKGTLDSLPGYLRDTAYEKDPWVYAEIGCSGRVFVDMRGVRAERAELLRLALPGPGLDEAARDQLADRYRVPVCGADDVPAWVIENVREGGPPPDERSLALDIGALELPVAEAWS
jgi:hypothetical protein